MDFQKFRSGGELSDVQVVVDDCIFKLHRFPLYTRSDFFLKEFAKHNGNQTITLDSFPGGKEIFTLVADFCYNIQISIDSSNVVGLQCAAKYLEMHGTGNLLEKTGLYIEDQVVDVKRSKGINVLLEIVASLPQYGDNKITKHAFIQCVSALTYHWNKCQYGVSGINEVTSSSCQTILFNMEFDFFTKFVKACKQQLEKEDILNALVSEYILHVITSQCGHSDRQSNQTSDGSSGHDDNTKIISSKSLVLIKDLLSEINGEPSTSKQAAAVWLKPLLAACSGEESSYEALGSIAALVANQMDEECIGMMTEGTLQHFAETVNKDNLSDSTKSLMVNHLLKQAQQGTLSSAGFIKLCQMLPLSDVSCHDNLLYIINDLTKAGEITKDQHDECLRFIDMRKCTPKALREVYQKNSQAASGGLPASIIAEAALDLCDSLQERLDATSNIIQEQEKEISSLSIQTFSTRSSLTSPHLITDKDVSSYGSLYNEPLTVNTGSSRLFESSTASMGKLNTMWTSQSNLPSNSYSESRYRLLALKRKPRNSQSK